jgi:hypothetical protein
MKKPTTSTPMDAGGVKKLSQFLKNVQLND